MFILIHSGLVDRGSLSGTLDENTEIWQRGHVLPFSSFQNLFVICIWSWCQLIGRHCNSVNQLDNHSTCLFVEILVVLCYVV